MRNLLKVDFYRMLKSKTTLIALILSLVMTAVFLLLTLALQGVLGTVGASPEEIKMTIPLISATLLQVNYEPFGDLGIVLIVFASIAVIGDINSGALRNKVIHGYKRSEIYFSHLITSLTFYIVLVSIGGFTYIAGLQIFYQYNIFADAGPEYVWMLILNGTLVFVLVSTLQMLILLGFKNAPLAIIIPIGVGVIVYFISNIFGAFVLEDNPMRYVLDLIPTYTMRLPNPLLGAPFAIEEGFITAGSTLVLSIINTALGLLLFTKKDLK